MTAILDPVAERSMSELAAFILRLHRGLLRDLRFEVVEGGVVLHGSAYTFYGKQVALHEVRQRCDCTVVGNRITVR